MRRANLRHANPIGHRAPACLEGQLAGVSAALAASLAASALAALAVLASAAAASASLTLASAVALRSLRGIAFSGLLRFSRLATPAASRKRITRSDGCAPFFIQACAFSMSNLR